MKDSQLLTQLLFSNEGLVQQNFSLSTFITDTTDGVDITLKAQSRQNKATNTSKGNLSFDAVITAAGSSSSVSGQLNALLTPETFFFNVEKF